METVRFLVDVFSDSAKEMATGEALLRARIKTDILPPTIWLSKITQPTIVIVGIKIPKDYVNIANCKKYGVSIARAATDEQVEVPGILYQDQHSWTVHFFDYTTSPLVAHGLEANFILYDKIMIDFFRSFGITIRREGNNLLVRDKKIGYSGITILYNNRIFWYDSNVLQDFPFDIVKELYTSTKHLPSPEQMTTLKLELGKYVPDKAVIAGIKASFKSLFKRRLVKGELTDLEKEIRDRAVSKHSDDEWILRGNTILDRAKLHRKAVNRLIWFIKLHGTKFDYLRPVLRYCPTTCLSYEECISQTVPAKTIGDQLEFCRKIAKSLPGDIVQAIEILD